MKVRLNDDILRILTSQREQRWQNNHQLKPGTHKYNRSRIVEDIELMCDAFCIHFNKGGFITQRGEILVYNSRPEQLDLGLRPATYDEGCCLLYEVAVFDGLEPLLALMPGQTLFAQPCFVCKGDGQFTFYGFELPHRPKQACFACCGRGWLRKDEHAIWKARVEQPTPDRRSKATNEQKKELMRFLARVFSTMRRADWNTHHRAFSDMGEILHHLPEHMLEDEIYWDLYLLGLKEYDKQFDTTWSSWFERIANMSE